MPNARLAASRNFARPPNRVEAVIRMQNALHASFPRHKGRDRAAGRDRYPQRWRFRGLPNLPQRHPLLISTGYSWEMLRVLAILLTLGVGLDLVALDGRYSGAAGRVFYSVFQHLR